MKKILFILLVLCSTASSADIFKLVDAINRNDTIGFISMVKTISDANTARSDNNKTILMYASYKGNKEAVEHLIAKGSSINAVDSNNATALHLAIWKDHTDIALFLLKKGASATTLSLDGMTPSDIALIRSNTKIIEAIESSKPKLKTLF
jgi:ankyrin repeat protein